MAFLDSRILSYPLERATSIVLGGTQSFSTYTRVITYPAISRATPYTSSAGGVIGPARIIPTRIFARVPAMDRSPSSFPAPLFNRARMIRPFALPVLAGDTGRRIVLNLRRFIAPGTRSYVLPDSTGRISHARIMRGYRGPADAETFHNLVGGL